MEVRHWHFIARQTDRNGIIFSRWHDHVPHEFIDIHESSLMLDYYKRLHQAVSILAEHDGWLDEFSLVEQIHRSYLAGQVIHINIIGVLPIKADQIAVEVQPKAMNRMLRTLGLAFDNPTIITAGVTDEPQVSKR